MSKNNPTDFNSIVINCSTNAFIAWSKTQVKAKKTIKQRLSAISIPQIGKHLTYLSIGLLSFGLILGIHWSDEPDLFAIKHNAEQLAAANAQTVVTGYTTTATLYTLANTLLTKKVAF